MWVTRRARNSSGPVGLVGAIEFISNMIDTESLAATTLRLLSQGVPVLTPKVIHSDETVPPAPGPLDRLAPTP